MKVVITGAAGQISYSLVPFLCQQGVFKSNEKINLALVEIPSAMERLDGFVKELEDSAYSTVNSISTFDNIQDAVIDADWCLLVGSIPRGIVLNGKEIKERSDLLQINGGIFTEQGKAIGEKAKQSCKNSRCWKPCKYKCSHWLQQFTKQKSVMDGDDNARCLKSKSSAINKIKLSC